MKARCRNGNLIFPPSDKPSSSSSELAASSAHTSKSSISTSPDKESAKVERVDVSLLSYIPELPKILHFLETFINSSFLLLQKKKNWII